MPVRVSPRVRLSAPMRLVLIALAAIACALALTRDARAGGPAFIRLDMDPATPGVQDTVTYPLGVDEITVDVVVENANAIGAFEFYLAFNPVFLELRGWSVGPFLGSTGRTVSCVQVITENTLRLGCTTSGPPPPDGPSGDGVLAHLRFHPRFAGETCISNLLVETAEVFGHALPTIGAGGCVVIQQPTPTPTATATNTPVPTATRTRTRTPVPTSTIAPTRTAAATRTTVATTTAVATSSPASTQTAIATASPTAGTATPARGTSTRTPGTSTPGISTPGATSSATAFATVLGEGSTPAGGGSSTGGPSGLPQTGSSFMRQHRDWVVTLMALTIGILLVALLRTSLRDERDR